MDAEPLSVVMAAGPLPAAEAVRVGRAICSALEAIHGELCPSAIEVSSGGTVIAPPGTFDRSRYGQYASPETVVGKPATGASDVFSIGAILFHAVAGRPPFRGDVPATMLLAICTAVPADLPAGLPSSLEAILFRCLEKDPAKRFASPAALAQALLVHDRQGAWSGKRLLAADDDAPIRELYSLLASHLGVEADIVATGKDAIEALKTRTYDVVLLDLNMARLSGWEVLDFLRPRHAQRPAKLFIVTGFSDQVVSDADREMVSGILYKPVAVEELRMLVSECLNGANPDLRAILKTTQHRLV